jgi:queuine/archaeosine tRNA-ribosyltransferase
MKSVQAWGPDMAVSFHDEINRTAGSNRTRACVDRASHWLQECVDFQTKQSEASSQSCALPALLAFLPCVADTVGRNFAIEKILSIVKRSYQHDMSIDHCNNGSTSSLPSQLSISSSSSASASVSIKSSIAGFVFGCLGQGETNQERIDILSDVISKLPDTQIRVISGVTTPFEILDCITLGIDLFDSDYPNLLTSAGLAATFHYKYDKSTPDTKSSSIMLEEDSIGSFSQSSSSPRHERHVEDNNDEGEKEEEVLKRKRNPAALTGTQMAEALVLERSRQILSNDPLPRIYLRSSRFLDDESPLVTSCGCFACSGLSKEKSAEMLPTSKDKRPISHPGHMRCYVNHLLETGELLGHVLLTTHNVYHFNAFFAEIRKSIEEGYFLEYKTWFRSINTSR